MQQVVPVILCGGSGTRLRSLSRKSFPKQFVPIIGSKSLLQLTLESVCLLSRAVICVSSREHRFLVSETVGMIAGNAQKEIELKTGKSIVSAKSAKQLK